ncbi:SDR family NAD(P)-dependent oxidoreductase [Kribbella sp. NPDC050281]|uniref:SDR family NAD(P)-dependent oxidoreductase n=1 Tax=Kribbella sp. NPDC050281 TaxID=3155515 RepID=UPI0033C7A73B
MEQSGGQGRLLNFDVSERDQCREVLEKDMAAHGAWYGVVCNAGIARDGAFPALSENDWDSVIHTNLDGFYNVIHPCIMPTSIQLPFGGGVFPIRRKRTRFRTPSADRREITARHAYGPPRRGAGHIRKPYLTSYGLPASGWHAISQRLRTDRHSGIKDA